VNGLILEAPEKLSWRNFPLSDSLKDHEVKLKVLYGGICGSDIGVYKGKLPHAVYPVIPGHEILGEVIEVGKKANIAVGQRVVVQPNSYCGTCEYCMAGKTNICPDKKSIGINVHGGFKEEIVIESKYAIPVPETLSNERAILIEPLSVIVHALEKADIKKGTSVAIVGCGTEGLLAVALASYLGANITAIDVNLEKLDEMKMQYPKIRIQHPKDVSADTFDIAVEVAGVKSSFEQCIDIVKPGGTIIAVGLPEVAEIPVVQLVREEITIKGSIIYNAVEDFKQSIHFLLEEDFYVEPIISEILPVTQYEEAYEKAVSGKYRKIILKF